MEQEGRMSYEKGDKFVLEIAEVFESGEKKLYRMKNFASLVFDENGLQKLRRIRETTEEAYKRGYAEGAFCSDGHPVVEQSAEQLAKARAEGAEEAWAFIRRIYTVDTNSKEFLWYKGNEAAYWRFPTYAEAKADFEKWKAAKTWEPKAGDVVACCGQEGVVLEVGKTCAYVLWLHDGISPCEIKDMDMTGKSVDLSQIFEAMQ